MVIIYSLMAIIKMNKRKSHKNTSSLIIISVTTNLPKSVVNFVIKDHQPHKSVLSIITQDKNSCGNCDFVTLYV